jgi:V-type H+-transporting ATPase subunit a
MIDVNSNHERLQRAAAELAELSLMLDSAGMFFDSARRAASGAGASPGGLGGMSSEQEINSPLLERESVSMVSIV